MSVNLKNPILIGVVLLGTAGVVALNINTFRKPQAARRARHNQAMQSHNEVPSGLVQLARENLVQEGLSRGPAEQRTLPVLQRDPFTQERVKTAAPVVKSRKNSKPARRKKAADKKIVCSAILLGSGSNTALIQGEAYEVGAKVSGYTIMEITIDGVKMRNGAGKQKFLSVGVQTDESNSYSVINNL